MPSLGDVTPAQWAALSARPVFFGHQSVGVNIVAGLADVLAAHPEITIALHESKVPAAMTRPGFYHAAVGRNYFPAEKSAEFAEIAGAMKAAGSVGMVKYCFVDVENTTDMDRLFATYQQDIDRLRAANRGLAIVHVTMPLFTDQGTFNYWKRKIRGYPNERARNHLRHRFNALLRGAYEGREPVFDLAALESRRPDGSRFAFRYAGETVDALAPEYTDDGGHLNEVARQTHGQSSSSSWPDSCRPRRGLRR